MLLAAILSTVWLTAEMAGQSPAPAASIPPTQTISVKIEASEADGLLLRQKLIQQGLEHKLKFEADEEGFAYRIGFALEVAEGSWLPKVRWSTRPKTYSITKVEVYDSIGVKLFEFRKSMSRTDEGAANAAAKEIVKRFVRMRSPAMEE